MTTRGGKRLGAGNKAGSIRPQLTDYWTKEDIADYFQHLKDNYKKSDRLAVFVGDHILGKAVQPIGNDGDQPFMISGVDVKLRK